MIQVHIDRSISELIPQFKIGVIYYHHIVVGESPQMIKGRSQLFQEQLQLELETKSFSDYEGITEWREIFKTLQTNPKRYPPSNEALFTRIKKVGPLPSVNSAVDLNTLFSLQFAVPAGIYDTATLDGDILLRLGAEGEQYDGLNGRKNTMHKKLVSADNNGAFGSPYVDSHRSKVTAATKDAIHFIYLRPTMEIAEAEKLLHSIGTMFTQVHGGDFSAVVQLAN